MDKIQEQQIIEGNKLIAEFMGGERHWLNGMKEPFTDDTIWGYYDVGVNITSTYSGRPIALVNDLKYHTSWDWLMPVVEKIESLGYMTIIGANAAFGGHYMNIMTGIKLPNDTFENPTKFMGSEDTKIATIYSAILQFIKWYTTTQTKNK